MSNPTHPWLPTSKKQSVLVYGLNVLLMLNLTVIVVMLAEMDEPADARADRPAAVVDTPEQLPVIQPQLGSVEATTVPSPAVDPVEPVRVTAEPFVLTHPQAEPASPAIATQPQPVVQPEADPPVTFFGVGLE